MGPILLCDKSTLQTLNSAAPELLHQYFSLNIPPILVREVLGDLAKTIHGNPVGFVRALAKKLAHHSIIPNADFRGLILCEMNGGTVNMKQRPIIVKGTEVTAENGEIGILLADDPCEKALNEWRIGNFTPLEEEASRAWREMKSQIDWRSASQKLKAWYPKEPKRKRSFEETIDFVDDAIACWPAESVRWLLEEFQIPTEVVNFSTVGFGRLPYTRFCARLALFSVWAMEFKLVYSKEDNLLDLEYLFYLPFCNVFTSRDRFQRKIAPVFLLPSQEFVDSEQLESDLVRLAKQVAEMSDEERQNESDFRGPPYDDSSICYRIWKRFMKPGYRERPKLQLTPENEKRLVDHLKMLKGGRVNTTPKLSSIDDASFVVRNRYLRASDLCPCGSRKAYKDCHGRNVEQ